jgi:hypothetical protein
VPCGARTTRSACSLGPSCTCTGSTAGGTRTTWCSSASQQAREALQQASEVRRALERSVPQDELYAGLGHRSIRVVGVVDLDDVRIEHGDCCARARRDDLTATDVVTKLPGACNVERQEQVPAEGSTSK